MPISGGGFHETGRYLKSNVETETYVPNIKGFCCRLNRGPAGAAKSTLCRPSANALRTSPIPSVYSATRPLFEGWVRQLLTFALIPVLTYAMLLHLEFHRRQSLCGHAKGWCIKRRLFFCLCGCRMNVQQVGDGRLGSRPTPGAFAEACLELFHRHANMLGTRRRHEPAHSPYISTVSFRQDRSLNRLEK